MIRSRPQCMSIRQVNAVYDMRQHVSAQVVKLDQDFGAAFAGVLTDDAGAVRALWGSYSEQASP